MTNIPLEHTLLLSAVLFSIGLVAVISKRNAIVVLMGVELIFNAANLNLIVFSRHDPQLLQGQIFALFIIVVAAAEAAVALAIVLKAFHYFKTTDLPEINQLKG